jgi:alpha-beta hydrolase superfamily lysophospholipase
MPSLQEERPIITVAHSLGGLVCAQVVVSGEKSDAGDSVSKIAKNIKGMVFLGTPFGGSAVAGWGELIRRIFDVIRRDTDQQTLRTLKPDAHELKDLRKSFPDIIRKRRGKPEAIGVVFFYERLKTHGIQV